MSLNGELHRRMLRVISELPKREGGHSLADNDTKHCSCAKIARHMKFMYILAFNGANRE